MISLTLPLKTISESNAREHWASKNRRVSAQRTCVELALRARIAGRVDAVMPCTIRLTRIAPRPLDDDNLRGALKACRDGAADALGIQDNDPRVAWTYDQRKGAPRVYALELALTPKET